MSCGCIWCGRTKTTGKNVKMMIVFAINLVLLGSFVEAVSGSGVGGRDLVTMAATEPQSLLLNLGDLAMLWCYSTGRPVPGAKWSRMDKQLTTVGGGGTGEYVLHSDGVLEIRSLQTKDFGAYRCHPDAVTNGHQPIGLAWINQDSVSKSQEITVPQFVMRPRDVIAVEGSVVILHCGANGRDRRRAQPTVVWLRDGATIDTTTTSKTMVDDDADDDDDGGSGRFSIIGRSSLRIDGAEEEDAGLYTCRASNLEDSTDAHALLTIHIKAKVEVELETIVAEVGEDVELRCVAHGIPRPSVQWMKNGKPVVATDYIHLEGVGGSILRVLGLIPSDAGSYQCTASNHLGQVDDDRALRLGVDNSSSFAKGIHHRRPVVGGGVPSMPLDLTAVPLSADSVRLTWKPPRDKGHSEVISYSVAWKEDGPSERERIMKTSSVEAKVEYLRPSTLYRFRVMAWNSLGPSSHPAQVSIQTLTQVLVPDVVVDLQAVALSSTSILLHWKTPAQTYGPITTYKVTYCIGDCGSATEREVKVVETVLTLSDLDVFKVYVFRVVASNRNGSGRATDEVSCRTLPDVPSTPPQNVSAEAISTTAIVVRWEAPQEDAQNGIIIGYKIRYKQRTEGVAGLGGGGGRGETVTTDGTRRMYELKDLERNVEYVIVVEALTVNGTGPSSPSILSSTLLDDLDESKVPGQPRSLRVRPSVNTISVTWLAPSEPEMAVRGYVLGYGIGIPDVYQQILDPRQRQHTIKGLRSGSEYVISLKAFNNLGQGRPIYETIQTREEQEPIGETSVQPPFGVRAFVLSSSSVMVHWSDGPTMTVVSRYQQRPSSDTHRVYTVRYGPKTGRRPKTVNTTQTSLRLDDLRPDTEYELSVRVSIGQRISPWSLSVFNRTMEAAPSSAARDVVVSEVEGRPDWATVSWQAPRQTNGQITGYLLFFAVDASLPDHEWVVEGVPGDRLTSVIRDLSLDTVYYVRVQARNANGYGPMTPSVAFRTPDRGGRGGGMVRDDADSYGGSSRAFDDVSPSETGVPTFIVWIVVTCVGGISLAVFVAVLFICCLRRHHGGSKDPGISGVSGGSGGLGEGTNSLSSSPAIDSITTDSTKLGSSVELKPPDLWEHDRRQMQSTEDEGISRRTNGRQASATTTTTRTLDDEGRSADNNWTATPPDHQNSVSSDVVSNRHIGSALTSSIYPPSTPRLLNLHSTSTTPRVNVGDITNCHRSPVIPLLSLAPPASVDYIMSTLERHAMRRQLMTSGCNGRGLASAGLTAGDIHPLSSPPPYQQHPLPPPPVPSDFPPFHQHQMAPSMSSSGGATSSLSLPPQMLSRSLKRFPSSSSASSSSASSSSTSSSSHPPHPPPLNSTPNTPKNFKHIVRPLPSSLYPSSTVSSYQSLANPSMTETRSAAATQPLIDPSQHHPLQSSSSLAPSSCTSTSSSAVRQPNKSCVSASRSTDELSVEMEHLEGLMKDLDTISRNELRF